MWQVRASNEWRNGYGVNLLRAGFVSSDGYHYCIFLSVAGFSLYLHRWVFK